MVHVAASVLSSVFLVFNLFLEFFAFGKRVGKPISKTVCKRARPNPNVLESRAGLLVVELWNSPSQLDPVFSNGLFY